jgi:hypothetical protein
VCFLCALFSSVSVILLSQCDVLVTHVFDAQERLLCLFESLLILFANRSRNDVLEIRQWSLFNLSPLH